MSNQQWRPPGNEQNNPWAQQDPNWRPQQFHDAQGRDPRQPFGQPSHQQPSIDELTPPPKSKGTWGVVIGVVGLIAALLVGAQFFTGGPSETGPSASVSVDPQATPTQSRTGNYIPFEGNGDGIFEIVDYQWGEQELRLRIRVEIETGEYGFAVFAFTNESRESYDPVDPNSFIVRAGEPVERDVTFVMPQADSTIVLTTPSGRVALNALPVEAP